MNSRAAWRDFWLVLTLVFTLAFLATTGLLLTGLLRDPYYMLALATRLDWLTSWPPRPDWEVVTVFAAPACAFLAWKFHRFYQEAIHLPPPPDSEADDPGP